MSIFNDQIYDVLGDDEMKWPLKMRSHGGTYIVGLSEYNVKNVIDVFSLLKRASHSV